MKKLAIIAAAVLALIVAIGLVRPIASRLWHSIYPPAATVRTSSTEIVNITLRRDMADAGMKLRIPKAFLVSDENWRGGDQEIVVIETRLPDLLPSPYSFTEPHRDSAEYKNYLSRLRNSLKITLSAAGAEIPQGMPRHRKRLTQSESFAGSRSKYELISPDHYGLERYREYSCYNEVSRTGTADTEHCLDTFREHYLPSADDKATVSIICNVEPMALKSPGFGCQAYGEFSGRAVNYIFRLSEIPRWREFNDGVHALLKRFTQ